MKKYVLTVVLTVMSIFLCAFTASAETKTYTLSLEEAISMAMEDNPQFTSAQTKIKDAEKQLAEAKKDQKNVKGVIRLPEGLQLAAVKKGYYVEQAKFGVESAKLEKIQAESKLSYEVTQKYYTLKLAQLLYASANDSYQLMLENKNNMDTQFSLGLVSQMDVNNANYAVMQAENMVNTYQRNLGIAKKNLMISLQIEDEDANFVLTDGIEFEEFTADLNSDAQKAMESRYDLYALKSMYEISGKYLDVTMLLGMKSSEYSAANQAMVQNEYTYNNTKKLIGLSINVSYNEILNAKDALKLAETGLSLREQEYEIAKVQAEIGMITNNQLTAALNNVANARIEYENAKLTYKLAVIKYEYEITIGL